MLLATLAAVSPAVAATRSRLAKRALLAQVIQQAGPDDITVAVRYLAGGLRQRKTGVGWAALNSLPTPAAQARLTLTEVDAAFEHLAGIGGSGSVARRTAALTELFGRATEAEQRFLRGLVFEDLRQGALEALVQDAVATAFAVPLKSVQRAAMLLGSTAEAARILVDGGLAAVAAIGLRVGVPLQPMLAAPASDPAAAVAKSSLPAIVDAKLDGIRVQVHKQGGEVQLYTRSLDEITERLPEVVEAIAVLELQTLVLDGEVVAIGPDGRPESCQIIASRTASKIDVDAGRARTPLRLFAFDLLHVDGLDLLDEPLRVRADRMKQILPPELIVPRNIAETEDEVAQIFLDAVSRGFEGVVVKNLDASYAAGRRDSGWIKLKPRHTFDLAVIAAEWGYGRRTGWLSNLHLAARDSSTGELVMLGKTFKGLTDQILTWQTTEFQARESRRTATTVYIDPPLVVEIAIDGIQQSVRYPGGIALRFARVLRYREDKTPDQVDSIDSVRSLGAASPEQASPDPD